MNDSDPQYLESQFLAAQAILEATEGVEEHTSRMLYDLRLEAIELVSHVMRNGTLPVRG